MPKSKARTKRDAATKLRQKGARRNGTGVKKKGKLRCGAIKKNGKPCLWEAGHGTDHVGTGKCKLHGGASPNGEVAAAKEEALGMAKPIEVTPGQALAGVLNLAAGQLAYVTWKVAALDEDEVISEVGVHPWVRLQRNMMIDVAKMAKLAADAGIDERLTNLAEQQTAIVATLVEHVLGDLNLTSEQRALAGPSLRKHITSITAEAREVESVPV